MSLFMILKNTSLYLRRKTSYFEEKQTSNFSVIYEIINSNKNATKEYEKECFGFLIPHTRNWMKYLIEKQYKGYSLLFLFDVPLRKTDNVLECLIPIELANKFDMENNPNICIEFKKFKKVYASHKGSNNSFGKWPIILIEDFDVINPIKLRLLSSKESHEAAKLRNDILFRELHIEVPSNVKLSILNSLFLAPKIKSLTGIESKGLIDNSASGRSLINLDSYNDLIKELIPPEISNVHLRSYRGDVTPHYINSMGETINIHMTYPLRGYYFNSVCTPNIQDDPNTLLRSISNNEIGINHQTKFKVFSTRKDLIDKLTVSEFFHKQDYLPDYSIMNVKSTKKLIDENRDLLYDDYVSRLFKQATIHPSTKSEKNRLMNLARDFVDEIGYQTKESRDPFFNNIYRSLAEGLTRVKAILDRSGFCTIGGLENVHLQSLQLNFDEIRESTDYSNLPKKDVDIPKIRKIMNNSSMALIVASLKRRGRVCHKDEILIDATELGHIDKDILKALDIMVKADIIDNLNGIIYLKDRDI